MRGVYCARARTMVHSPVMDTSTQKDLAIYELSYHLTRELTDSQSEVLLQTWRDAIVSAGGSFLAEGALEESDLAYPINKHTKSLFGWMKFEITTDAVSAIGESVRTDKAVLRHTLVKTVREDTRASAQARTPYAGAVVQEVETKGVLERKIGATEESGKAVSEEALDEALDDLTEEK